MKSITINGSQRESVGKKSTKALRNAGQVPCVVYGGDKPLHFSAPELAFSKLVYTPDAHTVVIALDNGESINAIMQDIQFHPVTDRIIHVDFYQIFDDKEITMDIPVKVVGSSKGVMNGGNLRRPYRKLRVKAIPANLPDFIEIDITPLKIGSKLYITELQNDAYKLLHPDNTVVCQVRRSRLAVVDEEEEGEDEEGATEEGAADAPATEATQE
ncbi:50S ribosomal protein L25/general stress protein Ctc [Winogradskyella sp. PC-19]|uniref:50S ribosomal protein L25/general stress protein Ctc n=1 Tax=unclassified Winogradskyella TaxID=2615021 RepID=UPI000B3C63D8|nr:MULTISPECIES: 50S ribosomal protein L25/general stress protein Ctc [unclassified Winogradskyella]ARV09912.1 50S ribosomal protein L25/general stress protein Ctc [Winogradskyella sp. PC-19]RZN84448.1 MAG: 50S ribosomal protein L25/general stress protein Ctc [Winogradskyella sp.]